MKQQCGRNGNCANSYYKYYCFICYKIEKVLKSMPYECWHQNQWSNYHSLSRGGFIEMTDITRALEIELTSKANIIIPLVVFEFCVTFDAWPWRRLVNCWYCWAVSWNEDVESLPTSLVETWFTKPEEAWFTSWKRLVLLVIWWVSNQFAASSFRMTLNATMSTNWATFLNILVFCTSIILDCKGMRRLSISWSTNFPLLFFLSTKRKHLGDRSEWIHGQNLTLNRRISFIETHEKMHGIFHFIIITPWFDVIASTCVSRFQLNQWLPNQSQLRIIRRNWHGPLLKRNKIVFQLKNEKAIVFLKTLLEITPNSLSWRTMQNTNLHLLWKWIQKPRSNYVIVAMPKRMSSRSNSRFWNGTIYKIELVLAKKHHLHREWEYVNDYTVIYTSTWN